MRDSSAKDRASDPDADGLERLTREFRPSLMRYFAKRVRQSAEVEDLTQETLVRLVRRGDITHFDSVRGYVFETASSVLKDWLRRRRVRHEDAHGPMDGLHLADESFENDRVLIGKERLEMVTAILLELPERPRTVFVLKRLEGMTYRAIAKRLGISESAAEKNMRRAIAHLIDRMAER
ncbi:RNA polymerase sigma factor [Glycocaulis sp.]|uniref:RNA polymerase sigma factor n=1 Tax=Glycocaulis sp. TaxID=1969725 RepID=UPI003D23B831